ncbi:hypothetical protein [Tolypothrix sp. VBCCA 56010]|uniref:hypothetical protein n=1 Tax=Tolypothrix sp. VBCCA 56010 TaxID=3137731 RepID=UPI003D7D80C1
MTKRQGGQGGQGGFSEGKREKPNTQCPIPNDGRCAVVGIPDGRCFNARDLPSGSPLRRERQSAQRGEPAHAAGSGNRHRRVDSPQRTASPMPNAQCSIPNDY